jgi:hypothetical protein
MSTSFLRTTLALCVVLLEGLRDVKLICNGEHSFLSRVFTFLLLVLQTVWYFMPTESRGRKPPFCLFLRESVFNIYKSIEKTQKLYF